VGRRLTTRQRVLRGGTVIVLLALIVGVLLARLRGDAATTRSSFLPLPTTAVFTTINERDDLNCLRDAAWRQDGRLLAVLGNTTDCPLTTYVPGIINIYSGDGKTLVRQIRPDASVFAALHVSAPSVSLATPTPPFRNTDNYTPPILYYHSILWSPDQQQLGATFAAVTSFAPLRQFSGLLVMNADGTQARVLLRQEQPSDNGYLYLVWGLSQGEPVTVRSVESSGDAPLDVTPALAYNWQPDGTLRPITPLTPQSMVARPAPGPVGAPDGGAFFTPWQPGTLTVYLQTRPNQGIPAMIATWAPIPFAAWSPDGRYLADTVALEGRFQPSGVPPPSAQVLQAQQAASLPVFPVRDAGLQQVLNSIPDIAPGLFPGEIGISLAWRSDGRVLAVFGNNGIYFNFYDCASGRLLTSIEDPGSPFSIGNSIMRWSPDGKWLLLGSGDLMNVQGV